MSEISGLERPRLRIGRCENPSPEAVQVYLAGGHGVAHGGPPNVVATLANHPRLLQRWTVFASYLLAESSLPPRDRELLILRVGVRCRSPYEFGQHHMIAQRNGVSIDEIDRVKDGPAHQDWDPFDAALLRAVDELHDDQFISEQTWSTLTTRYSNEQMLDLLFTVGNYNLVAYYVNSCGMPLDDGIPDSL